MPYNTLKVHTRINSTAYYIEVQHVRIGTVHRKNTPGFRMSQLYKIQGYS